MRLNEDLTEAIALGHDLGHTPFGHAGEMVLREIHPGGFDHFKQSLRVVDFLERSGQGLNLTQEVRNGIVKHSKGRGKIIPDRKSERSETLEGQIVRVCDLIAYVNHDLDDALRAEVIRRPEIPKPILNVLGDTHAKRIDVMVKDFIYSSRETDLEELRLSDKVSEAAYTLRDFLYAHVYESPVILDEFKKVKKILKDLYEYYLEHIEEVFADIPPEKKLNRHRMVCDFIAGMTDSFALMTYEKIFLPQQWTVL